MTAISLLTQLCPAARDVWEHMLPEYSLPPASVVRWQMALVLKELAESRWQSLCERCIFEEGYCSYECMGQGGTHAHLYDNADMQECQRRSLLFNRFKRRAKALDRVRPHGLRWVIHDISKVHLYRNGWPTARNVVRASTFIRWMAADRKEWWARMRIRNQHYALIAALRQSEFEQLL